MGHIATDPGSRDRNKELRARGIIQLDWSKFEFPTEPTLIRDMLLLVDVAVAILAIERWTRTQQIMAVNWAWATHLVASDNLLNEFCRAHDEDAGYDPPPRCICLPPRPDFLPSRST